MIKTVIILALAFLAIASAKPQYGLDSDEFAAAPYAGYGGSGGSGGYRPSSSSGGYGSGSGYLNYPVMPSYSGYPGYGGGLPQQSFYPGK